MTSAAFCSIEALAEAIPHGCMLAVAKDSSGVAMAATRELIRRRVRDLHLLCVPTGGLQAELLIGAGAARTLETSAITLGELGPAPRFVAALREGSVRMLDSTCPAVYAALQAGQKGLPFIALRGLIGSDVLLNRPDWKVIDSPFAPGDPIALLPALRPDIALFHASLADRHGNVFIGREREVLIMAHAAQQALVSVEEITDEDLLADEARAGAVLPAIYVSAIAHAPRGAWPLAYVERYPADEAVLARYVAAARTQEGFDAFVRKWLGESAAQAA